MEKKLEEEKAKKHDITSCFQIVDKKLRNINKQAKNNVLKNSSRTENKKDLTTPVNTTTKKTYFYLELDTPRERDYVARHKNVVGKLFKLIKEEDLDAVITYYEDQYEKSN